MERKVEEIEGGYEGGKEEDRGMKRVKTGIKGM